MLENGGVEKFRKYVGSNGILFDIDGVLAATSGPAVAYTNECIILPFLAGTVGKERRRALSREIKYTEQHTDYLSVRDWITRCSGIRPECFKEIDPFSEAIRIWNDIDRVVKASRREIGSLPLLQYLNKIAVPFKIASSRPAAVATATREWLDKKYDCIDPQQVFLQDGSAGINHNFKAAIAKQCGVRLTFEDSVAHAETISTEANATVTLVRQPWNEDVFARPLYYCMTHGRHIRSLDQEGNMLSLVANSGDRADILLGRLDTKRPGIINAFRTAVQYTSVIND